MDIALTSEDQDFRVAASVGSSAIRDGGGLVEWPWDGLCLLCGVPGTRTHNFIT